MSIKLFKFLFLEEKSSKSYVNTNTFSGFHRLHCRASKFYITISPLIRSSDHCGCISSSSFHLYLRSNFAEFPPFKIFKRFIPPPSLSRNLQSYYRKKFPRNLKQRGPNSTPITKSTRYTERKHVAAGSLGIIQPDLFDVEKSRREREERGNGEGRKRKR